MSMPNDPENSKPAVPQSPPEQAQPSASTPPRQAPPPTQSAPQATQPTRPYPYAAPQTPAYAAERGPLPPFNVMALIAFIGAFVIPVVGIVCGHITLGEYRKGLPERGREYARAGLILGYVFTAIWVVLAIIWIVFAFTHFGHASGGIRQGGGDFRGFGGGTRGSGSGSGSGFRLPTPGATPGS